MKFEIYKDRTCTGKEAENLRTIFDLQHEPSEQADDPEEEEDPLAEEDAWEDHQARQEEDHPVVHLEETTTTEIGTISKETMRAVI